MLCQSQVSFERGFENSTVALGAKHDTMDWLIGECQIDTCHVIDYIDVSTLFETPVGFDGIAMIDWEINKPMKSDWSSIARQFLRMMTVLGTRRELKQ